MVTRYYINEPCFHVGEFTVENQVELILFKTEFFERFRRFPEIKKVKEAVDD